MSAVPALALEKAPRRICPRHPIQAALDVIALRSGVPENLPGRCTDLSESGVGGIVAGQLSAGQQVGVELRLPNVGVPVRARAVVRYQSRLRCGFEFAGLPVEQQEMIRYWAYRITAQTKQPQVEKREPAINERDDARFDEGNDGTLAPVAKSWPRVRIRRWRFALLLAAMLLVAAAGCWQWLRWERSWSELESGANAAQDAPLRVPPETMEMRIVSKVDPVYPEEARRAGEEGLAILDAVIGTDGTVERLQAVSGNDLLVKSAEDAVRSWKFEPYQSLGRSVAVETTIAVDFRLN